MKLKGNYVALITPYNDDLSVNYEKLIQLVEMHIAAGVDGIVALGSTAEVMSLSMLEKLDIADCIIKAVAKRVPVFVGCGGGYTLNVVEEIKALERLGPTGFLAVTPYYTKPMERGMIEHFITLASSTSLPIIIYNVKGRTGISITEGAILALSKQENIIGIKEASGDIAFLSRIAKYQTDSFSIMCGNDEQLIPFLSLGAKGVISVASNIIPKPISKIIELYNDNKTTDALNLFLEYQDLLLALTLESNPIPIKCAMKYLGYNTGDLRLPLSVMEEKNEKVLVATIDSLNL